MATVPRWAVRENPNALIGIRRATFESIEQAIEDNNKSILKARAGLDTLVRLCIVVTKASAQAKSMGPVAEGRRSNPALAYRIPVQRITGRYFAGWTIRRVRSGHWMVYNDSYEAFLIEFGIYQRTRRPILKMSVIDMLKFVQTTRTGDRFVGWALAGRRDALGRFRSFDARIAGSPVLSAGNAAMSGPRGKLPG